VCDLDSNGPIRDKDGTTLPAAIGADLLTSVSGKLKRQIFLSQNVSFLMSLSTAEAHIWGVKFIGL